MKILGRDVLLSRRVYSPVFALRSLPFNRFPESPGADLNNNLITPSSRIGGNRLFGPLLGNNNRGAAARAREIIYSRRRRPGAPPRPEARSAAPSARAAASL